MIKISALLWSFLAALIISGLSFFYVNNVGGHGFPFRFAQEASQSASASFEVGSQAFAKVGFNYWIFTIDLLFWWLLFSILLVILRNYIFERN